jgi:hypothetical protein
VSRVRFLYSENSELVSGDEGTVVFFGKDENNKLLIEVAWDSGSNASLGEDDYWENISDTE